MKPHVRLWGTFVILVLTQTGCGSPRTSRTPTAQAGIPRIQLRTKEEAIRLATEANVSCSDDNCNESVGMLVIRDEENLFQCSGFLIAPDIIATNSHCIPDDIKNGISSCQGHIQVHFPSFGTHAYVTADCRDLIKASSLKGAVGESSASATLEGSTAAVITAVAQDYAFLRLTQSVPNRKPLRPSQQGFKDSEEVTIYKVNPISNTRPNGEMEASHCQATYGTEIIPDFVESKFAIPSFTGCKIVHGNSGSPIVASDGTARGIIQAIMNEDDLKETYPVDAEHGFEPFSLGTSFSCINNPLISDTLSEPCTVVRTELMKASLKKTNSPLNLYWRQQEQAYIPSIREWISSSSLPYGFQWGAQLMSVTTKGEVYMIPMPKCYFADAPALTNPSHLQNTQIPYRKFQKKLDRRLRATVEFLESSQGSVHFEFTDKRETENRIEVQNHLSQLLDLPAESTNATYVVRDYIENKLSRCK